MKYLLSVVIIFAIVQTVYSQDSSFTLGKTEKLATVAVYDLSDPTGLNIEVNLWGFVRFPGRYRVPINTTFMDLLSFSGGPMETTNLSDMRIIRTDVSGKPEVIILNYGDLLWEEKIKNEKRINPVLKAGDVIIVPQERRYTFRDNLAFFVPIVSAILTVATFIITISRK
jgi:hypothetical protein